MTQEKKFKKLLQKRFNQQIDAAELYQEQLIDVAVKEQMDINKNKPLMTKKAFIDLAYSMGWEALYDGKVRNFNLEE